MQYEPSDLAMISVGREVMANLELKKCIDRFMRKQRFAKRISFDICIYIEYCRYIIIMYLENFFFFFF